MIITENCTATQLKTLADGYMSDCHLVDMIRHPEEWEGIDLEVEEDYSENDFNAQNNSLKIVRIICPDHTIARFGYYEDGAHTVIDALDNEDMEEYLKGWISNNGSQPEDLHPLIYQTCIDFGLIDD